MIPCGIYCQTRRIKLPSLGDGTELRGKMDLSTNTLRKVTRPKLKLSMKILLFLLFISSVFTWIQRWSGKDKNGQMVARQAGNGWLQCITDIQKHIEDIYQDVFLERKYSEKDIIYIDPAQHQNLGDAFIVAGTQRLMVRFGFSPHNIYTCKESQAYLLENCNYTSWKHKEKFLAIWHGGGNWGDGWGHVHHSRLQSMKELLLESNATIVSFPQSVYYEEKSREADDARKLEGWINQTPTASRVVLSFRQENQIESTKSLYTFADVRLVPDIAFMIGPLLSSRTIWTGEEKNIQAPVADILFLLRKDKESSIDCTSVKSVIRTLGITNPDIKKKLEKITYNVTDWEGYAKVYRVKMFKEDDAMLKVEAGRNLLSLGRVIVTDRLHSSILALLMHKPHVFIEQNYGKISNTRNTAFAASEHCTQENLLFQQAHDLEDAIQLAIKFL